MKIVVLDGYTLNPGDLDWSDLQKIGDLEIYDRSAGREIISRAKGAEVVLTNKTVLDKDTLNALPDLKYIGVLATGFNVVDIEFARSKGISVTNTPNYTGLSGAQAVIALILELTNRVGAHSTGVKDGRWSKSIDFCYWDYPLVELDQLTLGILGYGGIGKRVAVVATSLGMKVMASTRTIPKEIPENITFVSQDELFQKADVLSLHIPLTPATEGLINRDSLKKMKKSALLINISRGGLVVEQDLAEALNTGEIAGAALDVLVTEPPDVSCPLFKAINCYITPHIAWATRASRERLLNIAVNNLKAFLKEESLNVVN